MAPRKRADGCEASCRLSTVRRTRNCRRSSTTTGRAGNAGEARRVATVARERAPGSRPPATLGSGVGGRVGCAQGAAAAHKARPRSATAAGSLAFVVGVEASRTERVRLARRPKSSSFAIAAARRSGPGRRRGPTLGRVDDCAAGVVARPRRAGLGPLSRRVSLACCGLDTGPGCAARHRFVAGFRAPFFAFVSTADGKRERRPLADETKAAPGKAAAAVGARVRRVGWAAAARLRP